MKKHQTKPLVLLLLDGWGVNENYFGNAFIKAKTPNFNSYITNYPTTTLNTKSIQFFCIKKNKTINNTINHCLKHKSSIHIITLLTESPSSSSFAKTIELIKYCIQKKCKNIFIHAILDGIEYKGHKGVNLIKEIELTFINNQSVKIASVTGSFYGMDKSNHIERTKKAYDAIVFGTGKQSNNPIDAINKSYENAIFDKEFTPTIITKNNQPIGKIKNNNGIIFTNFKQANTKQLLELILGNSQATDLPPSEITNLKIATFSKKIHNHSVQSFFAKSRSNLSLSYILRNNAIEQTIICDSYGYIAGNENYRLSSINIIKSSINPINRNEIRNSSILLKNKAVETIKKDQYKFIKVIFSDINTYANQGNIDKTIESIEHIDKCIDEIVKQVLKKDGTIIITSRNGNAEEMIDNMINLNNIGPTTNPVPFILIDNHFQGKCINRREISDNDLSMLEPTGSTINITPTILKILKIEKPDNIKYESLI
ncbi:hypothetical protein ISS03_02970 [Patescibacteria group bacterium]|nr:hypothetical protein [Patescibacteria group bacterium]